MIDQPMDLEGRGEAHGSLEILTPGELISSELPERYGTEDGREVVEIGDLDRASEIWAEQGNNLGVDGIHPFLGTCGPSSIAQLLDLFGLHTSERDIVSWAVANHDCVADSADPAKNGGTTTGWLMDILQAWGRNSGLTVRAESVSSMEQLADAFEEGKGVIVSVNCGVLWNDPNYYGSGVSNHWITIVGEARDPTTQALVGFYINDTSGYFKHGAQFISLDTMNDAVIGTAEQPVYGDLVEPIAKPQANVA